MITLCPTCNNTLDRKHLDSIGEDVLRCRVCRRWSVDGSATWLEAADIHRLRNMIKRRDDERRRDKEFLTSPITDPRWTQIYL